MEDGAPSEDVSRESGGSAGGLVTVVLDMNEALWAQVSAKGGEDNVTLASALSSVVVFLNAVQLMDRESEVCVVAECPDGTARVLARGVSDVGPAVEAAMDLVAKAAAVPKADQRSGLSTALSVALASTNRAMVDHKTRFGVDPLARVLVIQVTPDDPSQYIASMNSAFAAQKLGVLVDVVDLSPEPSKILQQVAHLSKGIVQRFETITTPALIEHLLTVYLPDAETRKLLKLPPQAAIVLQAACFCCGKLRDRGWVCSVCQDQAQFAYCVL
ncbi:RNA polymerase II transcription factor B subunit 4 [Hondaea fermentalgiana]|uniref:RNA polymerase II transcription factor B subunit 4 n=1 Tax=Hondaea fermentalgiana TaxID=2315210 RepID=A0A2R5GDD4_9STRA|nr:RNA polymerase II transcription factor B subunit 4 [Hondaea fermentalgiana]|eukprot:GBG28319.1 RNA polymerase II transcription factor B subunit 4 [Hondaea fermentalgiana]